MKILGFLNWFNEEQQPDMPDAKKIFYIACVLTPASKLDLLDLAERLHQQMPEGQTIPSDWKRAAHHMTVRRPGTVMQQDLQNQAMGQRVDLFIEFAAADEFAMAVGVRPVGLQMQPQNEHLHVTIAYSGAVGAKYSNDLLAQTPEQQRISVPKPKALESYLVAVGRDQTKTWPDVGVALASP